MPVEQVIPFTAGTASKANISHFNDNLKLEQTINETAKAVCKWMAFFIVLQPTGGKPWLVSFLLLILPLVTARLPLPTTQ